MIDLIFSNFTADKRYGLKFFKEITQKAIRKLGLKGKNIELSINLVGEDRIKALNKKYLGKNRVTDVLSFPINGKVSKKPVDNGIIALGDIFICLPVAKRSALKEGTSLGSKLALLTVHGLLHLMGYDHEKSRKEAEKMFKLQEEILKKWVVSSGQWVDEKISDYQL